MQALSGNPYTDLSPQQWQKALTDNETMLQRQGQLQSLQKQYTGSSFGGGGGFGSGASGSSSSSSSSGSSLFGGLDGTWDSYLGQAKDLARFRLGLDKEQAQFSSGLRETEFQNDFGRNYKLADQQIGGQKDLTNIQQSATTDRLQRQLDTQQTMQKSGFDQQNLFRAQSAALALRGLR